MAISQCKDCLNSIYATYKSMAEFITPFFSTSYSLLICSRLISSAITDCIAPKIQINGNGNSGIMLW